MSSATAQSADSATLKSKIVLPAPFKFAFFLKYFNGEVEGRERIIRTWFGDFGCQ